MEKANHYPLISLLYTHPQTGVFGVLCLLLVQYILSVIYEAFISPLSRFPGPFWCHVSNFPAAWHLWHGTHVFWTKHLHEQYGDIVRVTPNEISFISAEAYKDIYGQAPAGKPNLYKDERFYGSVKDLLNKTPGLAEADDSNHTRIRKIIRHGFSTKALLDQEPTFQSHTSFLVQTLKSAMAEDPGRRFDLCAYFNFITFDIMSDLAFSEPLHLLDTATYAPWIASIFNGLQAGTIFRSMRYWPILYKPLRFMFGKKLRDKRREQFQYAIDRVDRRLERDPENPDIWSLVLNAKEDDKLTLGEMQSTANSFMIAGTESTSAHLTGLTYYLLKNPDKMDRLVKEIRTSFESEDDIKIANLSQLEYLTACIEEGLRLHPPAPSGMHRKAPPEGAEVLGHPVPANKTVVYVSNYACFRSEKNFERSEEFIPERFIPGEEFDNDNKSALQPFSVGPRNCVGQNMAYVEMRMILIKMLWNFDIKLCEESEDWSEDQRVFLVWAKTPLFVQLESRNIGK